MLVLCSTYAAYILLYLLKCIYLFDAPYFSFMYNITMFILLYERTAKMNIEPVSQHYFKRAFGMTDDQCNDIFILRDA